jgi:hypothetical protein
MTIDSLWIYRFSGGRVEPAMILDTRIQILIDLDAYSTLTFCRIVVAFCFT